MLEVRRVLYPNARTFNELIPRNAPSHTVVRVIEFLEYWTPFQRRVRKSPTLGDHAKRRALDRVLNSNTFARSDQLRRFLRYVCEKEISGKTADISE